MRDPIEEDEGDRERRLDEEAAELRWSAFVEVVENYVESDGWPAVLAAVSWVMKERQRHA